MILALTVVFFIFGLIIGSFLNVVICRMNTKRSLGGRSACMSCQNKLCFYELIPLFSFFALGGRCRNCKTRISIQYPLVEFVTGLVFASLFLKFQDLFFTSPSPFIFIFAYYAYMLSILLVIAVYDLRHKIIPDTLALFFVVLSFIGLFFFTMDNNFLLFYPHIPSISEFFAGFLLALPFALLWLLTGGTWMGLGDAKLVMGIAWLLPLSMSLSAVVVAFWSGAVVGVGLLVYSRIKRKKSMGMKTEIPFAPFLVFGTFLALIFGLNLFGI